MLNNYMVVPSGLGVDAVYDSNGDMQFLGLSRNIQSSVVFNKKFVPHLCASVKVYAYIYLVFCRWSSSSSAICAS